MDLKIAIPRVRDAVVAVFKYRQTRAESIGKKGKVRPAEYRFGWGSGFCVVKDRYVVTAYHVLLDGQARHADDRFVVITVPSNGDPAYHFPVTGIPVEHPDSDLAVLELGPCSDPKIHLPAMPVSFAAPVDGTRVLTVGFPAPIVVGLNIHPAGHYVGGQFFLKSHANEGILSANYRLGTLDVFEFNVGWHNGESGGPVVLLDDSLAAFTVMQQYRNVPVGNATLPGPHRGCTLATIKSDLLRLGATAV